MESEVWDPSYLFQGKMGSSCLNTSTRKRSHESRSCWDCKTGQVSAEIKWWNGQKQKTFQEVIVRCLAGKYFASHPVVSSTSGDHSLHPNLRIALILTSSINLKSQFEYNKIDHFLQGYVGFVFSRLCGLFNG